MLRSFVTMLVLLTVAACAGPRKVNGILAKDQRVQFVYSQGIVECDLTKSPELTNCKDIPVTFEK